jgi:recombination protein RecT
MSNGSMSNVSTAVALRDEGAASIIEAYRDDLAAIMPSHMKPDVFTRLAVSVLSRDPKLLAAAQNNPASLLAALWEASRLGLEPGTEQYYLTHRNSRKRGPEIVGMTGYQGEIELIYRAGAVSSVTVEVYRENDVFVWKKGSLDSHNPPRWVGPQKFPYHEVDWFEEDGPRGALKGVYAYAEMKDGSVSKVIPLNRGHIEKAKEFSQGSNDPWSPWVVHEESMWLKTAAHRLRKWVPTSAEYMREQLRMVADVQAENVAVGVPTQVRPVAAEQLTAEDCRGLADDASTVDELTQALGRAQRAGHALEGDEVFQHFVARRGVLQAQEAAGGEVVLAHAHEGEYDATCEACKAEQAASDRQMAAV